MLQQSKGNKVRLTKAKKESCKSLPAYCMVSLGIIFSISLIALNPVAYADDHFVISIENSDNCSNNSCLSEDGLVIKQGSTVTWMNNDNTFHSILSGFQDSGRDGSFANEMILPGDKFSVDFERDGYYNYYCNSHPWMKGMILVSS